MGIRAQGLDMGSGANLYGVVNALLSLAEENFYFILFYYLYAIYYINYVENFIVVLKNCLCIFVVAEDYVNFCPRTITSDTTSTVIISRLISAYDLFLF